MIFISKYSWESKFICYPRQRSSSDTFALPYCDEETKYYTTVLRLVLAACTVSMNVSA